MTTTEYRITGMTCDHCARAVRDEVGLIEGVDSMAVSVEDGALAVTWSVGPDDGAVLDAVDEAGYVAVRVP